MRKKYSLIRWFVNISITNKLYFVVGVMALLIVMELLVLVFSINTLSSVRSYVGAEGLWSKAQKDAIYDLQKYARTGTDKDYQNFLHFLKTPLGYRMGRLEMGKEKPNHEIIKKGFIQGGSHPDDIDGMTKLFRRFHAISYINEAISIWSKGDSLMVVFEQLANDLHSDITTTGIYTYKVEQKLAQIDDLNIKFTILENDFSATLSEGSRWLESLILKILLSIALTVETSGLVLTIVISRNLSKSVGEILKASKQIAKGNLKAKAIVYSGDEIGILAGSFNAMTEKLEQNINERKKNLDELEKSNDRFFKIFDNNPVGMVISNAETTRYQYVNEVFISSFGYTKEEVIGKTLFELNLSSPEQYTKIIHELKSKGDVKDIEILVRKKNGETFWAFVSVHTLVINGQKFVLSSFHDISERKKNEEILTNKSKQLIEAQQLAHIGSWEWDVLANKLEWSDELYRIYGLDQEKFEANYENYLNCIHPDDREYVNNIIQTSFNNHDSFNFFHRIICFGKEIRVINSRGSVFTDDNNNTIRMTGTAQDVTEQKKYEIEIKQKSDELAIQSEQKDKRTAELNLANAELQAFNYIASHDLQEPLRKIRNFVKVMLDKEKENLSGDGKFYLQRTYETAERMRMLIEDLLTYSRTNNIESNFEKTNLNIILNEVIEDFKDSIHEKKAIIDAGSLCESSVIRFQFNQLFHNLVSNSLKFTKEDTAPQITIKSETIQGDKTSNTKLLPKVNYCHIIYEDNGIGFDAQYNERIFEVFQRLHSQEEYKGTGIGLAICKKIVGNHNGIITASGKLDVGARFDIYIPEKQDQSN